MVNIRSMVRLAVFSLCPAKRGTAPYWEHREKKSSQFLNMNPQLVSFDPISHVCGPVSSWMSHDSAYSGSPMIWLGCLRLAALRSCLISVVHSQSCRRHSTLILERGEDSGLGSHL